MLKHSVMSNSATPWTITHQASLSVGFFRQEYWSELPFSPPGDLPDPGIELTSPALASGFLFLLLFIFKVLYHFIDFCCTVWVNHNYTFIGRQILYHWAARGAQNYHMIQKFHFLFTSKGNEIRISKKYLYSVFIHDSRYRNNLCIYQWVNI